MIRFAAVLFILLCLTFPLNALAVTAGGISVDHSLGAVIVGPNSGTCTSSIQGAIRYTSSGSQLAYCNGSAWTTLSGGSSNSTSLVFGAQAVAAAALTASRFYLLTNTSTAASTENTVQQPVAIAGTFSNFCIKTVSVNNATSIPVTLRKNAVATAVVVTIPASQAAQSTICDTTHTATFAAGDQVDIATAASIGNATISGWSIQFDTLTPAAAVNLSIDALSDAISGASTVFLGTGAGPSNSGTGNTAVGISSMAANTSGNYNTVVGYQALSTSATSDANTAIGYQALKLGQSAATENTALGWKALTANTTGTNNTAVGKEALGRNTTSSGQVAIGHEALLTATTGQFNVAVGQAALTLVSTGSYNTAVGNLALTDMATTSNNTAVGEEALTNATGGGNTGIGSQAGSSVTSGTNNTFVGYNTQTASGAYTNSTALGSGATINASNIVQIGNGSITDVYFGTPYVAAATADGAGILTSTAGAAAAAVTHAKAYNTISDRRLKKDIVESDLGLAFIGKLRPVSYRFIAGGDESVNYGFIAQEVEKILGDRKTGIVRRQSDKMKTYELSYPELISPLVKAVQEQQDIIEQQQTMIRHMSVEIESIKQEIQGRP